MVRNYFFTLFFLCSGMSFGMFSQEPQIFKLEDFDLKGNVKSCLVVTNYGKEEYDFDEEGRLTKSVTRFSDADYDATHYKFEAGELIEKRMENYRDGRFEPSTSFANFYTIDQIEPRIVTEKIFSYDKEFLDSYQYNYDSEGKLIKIAHSSTDGEDETLIENTGEGRYRQQTYFMNDVIQKTITTTFDEEGVNKKVLSTQYLDGVRASATEKVYDKNLKLVSETQMSVKEKTKKFIPQEKKNYFYDDTGMLTKLVTMRKNVESVQNYIYQYDNEETGNWVKEIITPDNLYTTRRIKYYLAEKVVEKE